MFVLDTCASLRTVYRNCSCCNASSSHPIPEFLSLTTDRLKTLPMQTVDPVELTQTSTTARCVAAHMRVARSREIPNVVRPLTTNASLLMSKLTFESTKPFQVHPDTGLLTEQGLRDQARFVYSNENADWWIHLEVGARHTLPFFKTPFDVREHRLTPALGEDPTARIHPVPPSDAQSVRMLHAYLYLQMFSMCRDIPTRHYDTTGDAAILKRNETYVLPLAVRTLLNDTAFVNDTFELETLPVRTDGSRYVPGNRLFRPNPRRFPSSTRGHLVSQFFYGHHTSSLLKGYVVDARISHGGTRAEANAHLSPLDFGTSRSDAIRMGMGHSFSYYDTLVNHPPSFYENNVSRVPRTKFVTTLRDLAHLVAFDMAGMHASNVFGLVSLFHRTRYQGFFPALLNPGLGPLLNRKVCHKHAGGGSTELINLASASAVVFDSSNWASKQWYMQIRPDKYGVLLDNVRVGIPNVVGASTFTLPPLRLVVLEFLQSVQAHNRQGVSIGKMHDDSVEMKPRSRLYAVNVPINDTDSALVQARFFENNEFRFLTHDDEWVVPFPGVSALKPLTEDARYGSGTWCLSCTDPNGSPAEPSYPAGHATFAAGEATLAKALLNCNVTLDEFNSRLATMRDMNYLTPSMQHLLEGVLSYRVPSDDGQTLTLQENAPTTVADEIDKFAYNVAVGRTAHGVHWMEDVEEGLLHGETLALGILQDHMALHYAHYEMPELHFLIRKFSGEWIRVYSDRIEVA